MTDATELDIDAIRSRVDAATDLWTWREATDETIAGWGAHMGQMLYRLPDDGQTRDMKASILAMMADLPAALDEITRLRAALDEALSDHLCACGYGVVCGQCQRVDRARAEAAEKALDEARAEVECEREYADADTRTATEMATRALAAESALATVRAGLTEALDELVECRSFISVETRHYPTVHAINEVVEHLRPLATPTTMERNKG